MSSGQIHGKMDTQELLNVPLYNGQFLIHVRHHHPPEVAEVPEAGGMGYMQCCTGSFMGRFWRAL